MIRNSIYLILLAVFLSSVASIACKSKISTSDTSDIKTAAEILNSTGIAMQSISSFIFKLTHENLQGTRIGNLILSEANGTISSDNSMLLEGKFILGNLTLSSGFSTVGGNSFFLNPLTQNWEMSEISTSPLAFFDAQKGIQNILSTIKYPEFASDSKKYWNIEGFMPSSALSPLIGDTINNDVKVIVWIDKKSLYLTRAVISGKLNKYDDIKDESIIQRIISLSRFDEKVIIENPLK